MPASLIACLQGAGPIPEAEQALILAAWQPRTVAEGETLLASGHICRERFFIEEGILRIMVQQASGKEVTHFFLKEGQFCTILRSFENQVPAAESIQSACAARVRSITRARLEALCQQLPYLRVYLSQITQQALLEKIQTRNAYLGLDSTTRYQQFLRQQPDIARRVPLADVASYLGITPQSLSRIRKNIS
jgi:CRP-like cAMP-binding protein